LPSQPNLGPLGHYLSSTKNIRRGTAHVIRKEKMSLDSELVTKGKEAFKAGDYEIAVEAFTGAIKSVDDLFNVFYTRAQAYIKQGNYKLALMDAYAATAINPTHSKPYLLLANVLRRLNRFNDEVTTYEDGLANCPSDSCQKLLQRGLHEAKKVSKSILNDPRMMQLFFEFDKDKDSTVDFKEVAVGLYQLLGDVDEAQRNAAGLLLMMDDSLDSKRTLTYEKFAKLVLSMAGASGIPFDTLVDQLKEAMKKPVSDAAIQEILVTQQGLHEAQAKLAAERERKKTLDALSYSRTSKLFDLWDTDQSGALSFQELMTGLRKYQRALVTGHISGDFAQHVPGVMADVERDALLVMGHDKDSNQELDKEEFAHAMSNYAEHIGVDLHELIDFMVVVSSQSETIEFEAMYSDVTPLSRGTFQKQSARNATKFQQSLGTILAIGEENEDEEEDDGW